MESDQVPFKVVLEFLESQNWSLQRIDPPYRVFLKEHELPILVEVSNGMVNADVFKKIIRSL